MWVSGRDVRIQKSRSQEPEVKSVADDTLCIAVFLGNSPHFGSRILTPDA